MSAVLLVVHMLLALAIIGLVLLQRSEGGGLGIGGGGAGGLATPQGAASALTRVTWWCVAGFFLTSLSLGILSGKGGSASSIMDRLDTPVAATAPATIPDAPAEGEATAADAAPAAPAAEEKPAATPEAPVAE